jgi:RHS repeat-associated protein
MSWSSFLGLSSATGPNGDQGSITYDSNARPYTVTSPYGAMTNYTYNDTASPPNHIATTNGHWIETVMDGFGRTIQTDTGYSSTTISTVDTQYAPCGCSPLGKLSKQSAPYAPGGSDAWTTYTYDASGRTLSVALPDASTTSYIYQGNTVKVTDPASKWKTFTMDAFGNLTSVVEPDPSPLGNVTTSYTYDVLNHLTQVSMPRGTTTQTRTFSYNTGTTVTGFLQSATNPENGTVAYTYGTNNVLASKTDAKSQNFTYQYDSYNRLTSVTWANAPGGAKVLRSYMYDSNTLDSTFSGSYTQGRLVAVQNAQFTPGNGSLVTWIQPVEMYAYTQPGSVSGKRLQLNEQIPYPSPNGQTLTRDLDAAYTYNNEGKMSSANYPTTWTYNSGGVAQSATGSTYTYSFDSMWRLAGMTDQNNNTDVSGVTYNPANQLTGISYFGMGETRSYNSLGQMTQLAAGSTYYNYTYPTGTNIGKVSSIYDAYGGETVTYAYDSLNRMISAAATVGGTATWGETYGYDSFGNLSAKTPTAGTPPTLSQAANQANNQIVGYSYDANGNQLGAPGFTGSATYDAENRMVAAPGVQYGYDSQNKRVWSGTINGSNNLTAQTAYFYGVNGQLIGSYSLYVNYGAGQYLEFSDPPVTQAVYFGGKRVGTTQSGTTTAYWQDRLGSNRNGAVRYYPWGEARGTNPQDTWNYATYWQDSATGLDYANNRYYSNAYGRFMTVDPKGGHLSNPQSLNRYAYVLGDPVNRNDPRGLCSVMISGITMGPGTNSAWEGEATSLGSDTAYPYSGQNTADSVASVQWQAQEGSNAATYTAYYTILAAEASSSTPIDIIAYSGGAGAFAAAWKLLTAAQQADIGSIVYMAPGSAGATLPSNAATSTYTFVGGSGPINGITSAGTNPVGSVTNTTCNHTDLNCLFQWAAGTIGNGGGPCAPQQSLTLQQATFYLAAVTGATQQQLTTTMWGNISNYMAGLASEFLDWVDGIPVGGPDTEVDSTINYYF